MKSKLTWILTSFMVLCVSFSFAQGKTISGNVTDQEGLPLPGVSVVVVGTTSGTQTDFDGNYTISANAGQVLKFSYIGQKTAERTVGSGDVINLQMEEDAQALEEVIVLGYSTRGKNEITGSTVQLKSSEINDVPLVTVDQALQGKVAGLTIASSSGTPGSTQDIRIRGVGSISASNDPLFVIDGVPVISGNFSGSNSFSSLSALSAINNQDVESITVLKDASATSAYGARGSNGVVVITTKKGKQGKTSFNYTSSYGVQDFAVDQPTPLTAAQREQLYYDALYNTFGDGGNNFTRAEAPAEAPSRGGWGAYAAWIDAGRPEGNWGEEVKRSNPTIVNHNLSASGGDEKGSFYASLGYSKTEALVVGSDFERINGVFNFTRNLTDKLKFDTNMNVSNTRQNAFLEQSAFFANPFLSRYFMPPTEQPYNADGSLNTSLNTSLFNTLYLAENDIAENDLTRAIINSSLEYEIIDRLKFKTRFSIDYNLASYRRYENRIHGGGLADNGTAESSVNRNFNWVTQNSLNYTFSVGQHNFDLTALQEYQKNKTNYLYGAGENFPVDGLTYLDNTSANYAVSSNFTDWANASYLGLLNYNFAGKYIFDATYRNEGSSRFAPGLRFGDFWSVGAAWNVTQEDFMSSVDFVSQLRLRGSYGVSGNSGIDINSYQALLGFSADYDNQGAIFPTGFGNSLLTWEKNANYDIGIDYGFFNDVVSGSVAYFNKRTYDLLQNVPLSRTTGFSEVATNIGEIVNKGVEVEATFNVIRSSDMNWSFSGNFATLDNEVTKLALDGNGEEITITTGTRRIEVGQPINAWYMRGWAGVDPANGDPLWYVNGTDGATTNDYNAAEVAYQGENATPQYSAGFGTHFDFKGFSFDADFYTAGGHKVYEDWSRYTKSNGTFSTRTFNGTSELLNSWTTPGQITDYPALRANAGDGNRASFTSSRFLYEGDYVRLRNLSLGYSLPSSATKALGMDAINFSVRGTNLLTWVKDDRLKYDPEVRADGFTRLTTPPVKSVVFGVNLKF